LDGVWIGEPYTHHSELHATTALSLISALYPLLLHPPLSSVYQSPINYTLQISRCYRTYKVFSSCRTINSQLNSRFFRQLRTPEFSIEFSAATVSYLLPISSQSSSQTSTLDSQFSTKSLNHFS
jgi:hypothetical protein